MQGYAHRAPVLLAKLFLCPPPSLTHTQPLPLASLLPPAITQLHSTHILACQGHSSQISLGQTQSANLSSSNFNTHPELATFYHLCQYCSGLSCFFNLDYCLLIRRPVFPCYPTFCSPSSSQNDLIPLLDPTTGFPSHVGGKANP